MKKKHQKRERQTEDKGTRKESEVLEKREDNMPPLEQINGKDVGLQIITKENVGWPKETMNIRHIMLAIEQGK